MNFQHSEIFTDILLLDVVGFSKLPDSAQFLCIQTLQSLTKQHLAILGERLPRDADLVIGFIPTGDGFYFILHPGVAGYGPLLALTLRNAFHVSKESIQGLHEGVRVAVHFGMAIPFYDICRHLNFVGSGLNDTARLLSLNDKIRPEVEAFAGDASDAIVSDSSMNADSAGAASNHISA